jgi:hypothetical protein
MRKGMWRKGLTVAMAAAMLAGPVSVPAVFHNTAIVKADEETGLKNPKTLRAVDGYYYATVNMEYADYYYGELNKVSDVSTLDLSKGDIVDATYKNGEYDAVTSATTKKSKGFEATYYTENVQNDETGEEATGVNINGIANVQIRIPVALYEAYYNAYQENKNKGLSVYKYLENAQFSDTAFDEYKELNGDGTFKATSDEGRTLEDATASITSSSKWGNWQISVEGLPSYVTKKSMEGVIIETTDGAKYGMLHEDNLWLQPKEIAFSAISFSEPHGNHMSYKHTQSLSGKTIKKITYILRKTEAYEESGRGGSVTQIPECDGKDIVINTNLFVKSLLNENEGITAAEATYSSEGTKVTFDTTKTPKDAAYKVAKITKGSGRAPETIDTSLYQYENGVLTFDKSILAGDDYTVTFESDKYADLKVKVIIKEPEATTATKPSTTTTATKPSTTTTTKPSTTTTTKPAVKPVKKVTVKKQAAKVKAGKKKLTVTWKKDKNVSGYQIKIATKKNFKGAKTYTVKSYKTYKKVIKKLKAKKKYFVKVRAYKTVGKSKVYGAYSAVRSCKVK